MARSGARARGDRAGGAGRRQRLGSQDLDARARTLRGFSRGEFQELATKPVIAGAGCNFQGACWWAIFLGIGFKFRDFIQAIHRVQRFGQTRQVRVDLIYSEAERAVRRGLETKWRQHEETSARMSEIIRRFGLGLAGAAGVLERTVENGGGGSVEFDCGSAVDGAPLREWGWRVERNDTVLATRAMPSDSVGLIVTSVPFSTQYEYSPSYNDFGHSDDSPHFFRQMDFLTPELLRVLQPGRRLAVHVKDRVRPGGMDGLGFQTVDPFYAQCIEHYRAHGFAYLGMITIVTDVVRENAQTYRLGWTEQCKDGSRMGVGMPEYLLLFRKPQTDRSRGYADAPVVKSKPRVVAEGGEVVDWDDARIRNNRAQLIAGSGYSRSRWQNDAAGFWRSSGDRVVSAEDLIGIPHDAIFKLYRGFSFATVYDHEHHVALTESMEARHALPTDFALMPPQSWHPEVWTDVARMLGANTLQAAKGREQHLCPLPFDIVDRAIGGWSNPGDLVYDPFGGLMTVPLRAVKLGRRGAASELNAGYFADGVRLLREQDAGRATPSLFDLLEQERRLMADEVDMAVEIAAEHLARSIAAARVAVPDGVAGECDECGDASPRLIGGRCAPCRDCEARMLRMLGRPAPFRVLDPEDDEEETTVATPAPPPPDERERQRQITFMAKGALLAAIEDGYRDDGTSLGRVAMQLAERGLMAGEPALPDEAAPIPLDQVHFEALIGEVKRRFDLAGDPAERDALAVRADAAESKLAALREALAA